MAAAGEAAAHSHAASLTAPASGVGQRHHHRRHRGREQSPNNPARQPPPASPSTLLPVGVIVAVLGLCAVYNASTLLQAGGWASAATALSAAAALACGGWLFLSLAPALRSQVLAPPPVGPLSGVVYRRMPLSTPARSGTRSRRPPPPSQQAAPAADAYWSPAVPPLLTPAAPPPPLPQQPLQLVPLPVPTGEGAPVPPVESVALIAQPAAPEAPGAAPRSPMYISSAPLPDGCRRYLPVSIILHQPLALVARALFSKYTLPNDPFHPGVTSARWVHDELEPRYALVHKKREVVIDLEAIMPYLVRRALPTTRLEVHEHYEWHRTVGVLHSHVHNVTLRDVAQFQEVAVYKSHATEPAWTVYESRVEVHGHGWIGGAAMRVLPADAEALLANHIACVKARVAALAASDAMERIAA